MKQIILSILAISLISGCSTAPKVPKSHETKYAIQVVVANVAEGVFPRTFPDIENPNEQISKIFSHPDTKLEKFPIVYAEPKINVVIDRTKTKLLAEGFSVVDGKAIEKKKEYKIGKLVSVTIDDADQETVTYTIDSSYQKITGYDEHLIADGDKVKIPFFEKREVKTSITQIYKSWAMLGGLVEEDSEGNKSELIYCVRVIPPQG